jgi:putative CRISPR-associated protein (TIGR02619 family)
MKKVISTVGTSFIENYEKTTQDYLTDGNTLKKPVRNFDDAYYDGNVTELLSWASKCAPEKISAELASIVKLSETYKEEQIEVYLLSSDTASSYTCALAAKKYFEDNNNISVKEVTVIENLRLENLTIFNLGKDNLIREISKLIDKAEPGNDRKKWKEVSKNFIFNVTGGYKGIIPILTILSQLYECEIIYKFEESDGLLKIPRIPINFDPVLTEGLFLDLWFKREKKDKHDFKYIDKLKAFGFIEKDKFTALGELFYEMAQRKQAAGKNVFGYFIEYKILEYLYIQGKFGFTHSHEEIGKDGKPCELDFAFSRSDDSLEVWEVKSALIFLDTNLTEEKIGQLNRQLDNYAISVYKLIVYSIDDRIPDKVTGSIKKIIDDFKVFYPYTKFSAEFLHLTGLSKSQEIKRKNNPYQVLFNSKLVEKDFTKIY